MPVSKPTRNSAYDLRVSAAGREDWYRCASVEALAREVASRAGLNDRQYGWGARVDPNPDPVYRLSEDGGTLHWLREYSEQVGRNLWGPIQVRRTDWVSYEAFAPNGSLLKVGHLLQVGSGLNLAARRFCCWRIANRGYCGYGPVPGVRKHRGGGGCCRRIRTTSERRLNALVLREEGEVAARPSRSGHGLPDSWDDIQRGHERNWKNQHKGRKSWDRCGHVDGGARCE